MIGFQYIKMMKNHSFTKWEADRILKRHGGDHGIVRYRHTLDNFYYPENRICQLCLWQGVGNEVILGEGISWRKAFEDAGVFYENGDKIRI